MVCSGREILAAPELLLLMEVFDADLSILEIRSICRFLYPMLLLVLGERVCAWFHCVHLYPLFWNLYLITRPSPFPLQDTFPWNLHFKTQIAQEKYRILGGAYDSQGGLLVVSYALYVWPLKFSVYRLRKMQILKGPAPDEVQIRPPGRPEKGR